jgi:flavodoxin
MKTLVVYDSKFGNTAKLAQAMANALQEYGEARAVQVGQTNPAEFAKVDLVILGCPIQAWKPSPGMREFMEQVTPESLRTTKIACFDTRMHLPRWFTGSGAEALIKQLRKLGAEPIAESTGFFVKEREGPLEVGEMERGIEWAKQVGEKAKGRQ